MRLSERGIMPREQINIPARRTITTYLPDRAHPTEPGVVLEGNGLNPGEWALGWAQPGDQLHDGQHWENTPVVFVGWNARDPFEPSMTLEMTVDADEVLRAATEINRLRALALAGDIGAAQPDWTFSTIVLDRPSTQKAIRTIRRARDTVFEADE